MSTPDLNLLITLDVLLAEGNVTCAAERLRLNPSAMSRVWHPRLQADPAHQWLRACVRDVCTTPGDHATLPGATDAQTPRP